MAPMGVWGGGRGLGGRALPFILVGILIVGAAIAAVVAPGAVGGAVPAVRPSSAPSGVGVAGGVHPGVGSRVAGRNTSSAPTMPTTASAAIPLAAKVASAELTADTTTEEGVATRLIAAIDAGSHGRFSIRTTLDNVELLDTWMDNEGGLWANNPLNTSLDAVRYPDQLTASGEDTHIPIFPDIQIGIDATVTTLLSNPAYSGILRTLSEGTAPCPAFASVVMASPWAASHYGDNASHFCGAPAGSGAPGGVLTACLRLPRASTRGGRRRDDMPGACGGQATGVRSAPDRHESRRQRKAMGKTVRPYHQRAGTGAASRRQGSAPLPSAVRRVAASRHRR
jgi:hypothetical protein